MFFTKKWLEQEKKKTSGLKKQMKKKADGSRNLTQVHEIGTQVLTIVARKKPGFKTEVLQPYLKLANKYMTYSFSNCKLLGC